MILFAGDPHGEYTHLYPFIQAHSNLSLIILGDLQLSGTEDLDKLAQYCDIWFIHGNHDSKTVKAFESIWGSQWHARNLHNKVVKIDNVRIAGLGGVFRGQIWMPPKKPLYFDPRHYCQCISTDKIWRGGIPLRHRSSIFPSDIEILENQQADILICHEAPKPHPMGFKIINELAENMGVKHIFHGHHHENFNYSNSPNNYPYRITNVGFRSLANIEGKYLLKNIDNRK
ncbi:metallophosphoesterase family protein [Rodentibacter caecimuris]|uniref:Calcineurin-like phosphoesterase domain-containing protein n=1 Tax=Rodentibacter caecimuris TaxID=1796644 RepID=A0ABX3L1H6_9PAST|nr:hypothetical protein BKG89_00660 [Rodentibacter heylii]